MSLPSFFCISASFCVFFIFSSHLQRDRFLSQSRFPTFSVFDLSDLSVQIFSAHSYVNDAENSCRNACRRYHRSENHRHNAESLFHFSSSIPNFSHRFRYTDFLCTDFLCRIPLMRAESFILMIIVYQMLSFYSIRRIFKFPPPSATLPSGVRS